MPCSCLENVLAITIYIDFSVLLPSIFGYRITYGDGIMYVQINRSLWACLTNRNAKSVGLMETWKYFSVSNNLTHFISLQIATIQQRKILQKKSKDGRQILDALLRALLT